LVIGVAVSSSKGQEGFVQLVLVVIYYEEEKKVKKTGWGRAPNGQQLILIPCHTTAPLQPLSITTQQKGR